MATTDSADLVLFVNDVAELYTYLIVAMKVRRGSSEAK